jgi:anti-sigma regulatory factor (Ser/Thr protein kinase)
VPEASLTLPADLSSVSQARNFLRHALADWAVEGFELAAPQVLTELATNAALHARSAYTVHLQLDGGHLLVEVSDSSRMMPQQRHYGTGATTGRGISLIQALSEAWGVESSPTGKTVWCRVGSDDALPDFDFDDADEIDGTNDTVGASSTGAKPVGARSATTRGRTGVSLAFAA